MAPAPRCSCGLGTGPVNKALSPGFLNEGPWFLLSSAHSRAFWSLTKARHRDFPLQTLRWALQGVLK